MKQKCITKYDIICNEFINSELARYGNPKSEIELIIFLLGQKMKRHEEDSSMRERNLYRNYDNIRGNR